MGRREAKLVGPEAIALTTGDYPVMTYVSFGPTNGPQYNSFEDATAWLRLLTEAFNKVDLRLADDLQWRNALIDNLFKDNQLLGRLRDLASIQAIFPNGATLDPRNLPKLARDYETITQWIQSNAEIIRDNKRQVAMVCEAWQEKLAASLPNSPSIVKNGSKNTSKSISKKDLRNKITVSKWEDCTRPPEYISCRNELLQLLIKGEPTANSREGSFFKHFSTVLNDRVAELTKRNNIKERLEAIKTANPTEHITLINLITVLCFDYLLEEAAEMYLHKVSLKATADAENPNDGAEVEIVYAYPAKLNAVINFLINNRISERDANVTIHFLTIETEEVAPQVVRQKDLSSAAHSTTSYANSALSTLFPSVMSTGQPYITNGQPVMYLPANTVPHVNGMHDVASLPSNGTALPNGATHNLNGTGLSNVVAHHTNGRYNGSSLLGTGIPGVTGKRRNSPPPHTGSDSSNSSNSRGGDSTSDEDSPRSSDGSPPKNDPLKKAKDDCNASFMATVPQLCTYIRNSVFLTEKTYSEVNGLLLELLQLVNLQTVERQGVNDASHVANGTSQSQTGSSEHKRPRSFSDVKIQVNEDTIRDAIKSSATVDLDNRFQQFTSKLCDYHVAMAMHKSTYQKYCLSFDDTEKARLELITVRLESFDRFINKLSAEYESKKRQIAAPSQDNTIQDDRILPPAHHIDSISRPVVPAPRN